MNLINEAAGDYRPEEWSVLDYMPKHEKGLNKLRLQTAFGALNRQRAGLRAAIAAFDRGEKAHMSSEELLHRMYLRDGIVGAYCSIESAMASLAEASGQAFMVKRDPLPELDSIGGEIPRSEPLPF